MRLDGRIKKLERERGESFADIRAWERAGRLYSELSEQERERYCQYWNFSRDSFERMYQVMGLSLDFPVECKKYFRNEREEREFIKARAEEIKKLMLADD